MLVYHFRNKKYGLKSLKEQRIKISRISELNDQFELLGCNLGDKKIRKDFKEIKNVMSGKTGLLCFSTNWQSPVQWAHYADNHKGVCLGFEVKDEWLAKVDYVTTRLACPTEFSVDYMQKMLTTKFCHWAYEEEYRGFINLDPSTEENGLYYKEFSDTLIFKKVIVGCESDITRCDIADVLSCYGDMKIEYFQARPAFTDFKIVKNKNNKLWT